VELPPAVEAARVAVTARDIKGKAAAIDHALQIVSELAAALDHGAAPALAANLGSLYDFVSQRLSEASLTMKPGPLEPCPRIMGQPPAAFRAGAVKGLGVQGSKLHDPGGPRGLTRLQPLRAGLPRQRQGESEAQGDQHAPARRAQGA